MPRQSAAPGLAPRAAVSTALDTGSGERGTEIVALSSPPASAAIADAIVSRDPTTEGGMVARANELHRAGIVRQCVELFGLVAQLKAGVLRDRATTWKEYVEKNFTFSLATADNYARIGRGDPTVLTPLGAVRHLHQSGRPGHKAAKKVISKEEMATATEAETVPVGLMSGAPTTRAQPAESARASVELAVKLIKAAVLARKIRSPRCVEELSSLRARATRLRNELARIEQELHAAERQVMAAYKGLKDEAAIDQAANEVRA
jgi:hypothetical protein